jgi:hypothetical protein
MKRKLQILSMGLLTSVIGLAAKLPSESYKSPGLPGDPGDAPIGDGFWVLAVLVAAYMGYRVYCTIKAKKSVQVK